MKYSHRARLSNPSSQMIYTALKASLLMIGCMSISVLCSPDSTPQITSLCIESEIKYTYARTVVTSQVKNSANFSQIVYFSVILTENAFITGFLMIINGVTYKAYVKEKEEAQKIFDEAVKANQSAALVQTDIRDSKAFNVSVNIEAYETVEFKLSYEELLSRENGSYTHKININPKQIVPILDIIVDIEDYLAIKYVKVYQLKTSNEINQTEVENPNVKKEFISPQRIRVEWSPTEEEQKELNAEGLNGQMTVEYDVDTCGNEQLVLVDQDGYFVHILRYDDLPPLKRHVIFILDVSGSMYGNKIEQLRQAMLKILSDLYEQDYFSIILFSTSVLPWKIDGVDLQVLSSFDYDFGQEPTIVPVNESYIIPATRPNITIAQEFIKTISTYGSTNINGSLRCGIDLSKLAQKMFHNCTSPVETLIIFLTDGLPNVEESDPGKITENVVKDNKGNKRCNHFRPWASIFSLAFGDDADFTFLKNLSLSNNGFARRIYEASDAALQLQYFYDVIASLVLADVKFEYIPDQVEVFTPPEMSTLFSGAEIKVVGKVKPNGNISGKISVNTPKGRKKIPIRHMVILPPPKDSTEQFGSLEKMWAWKTVKYYEDQYLISKNDTIKQEAINISLKYSFVTQWTSLVVVKPDNNSLVDEQEGGTNPGSGPLGGAIFPTSISKFAGGPFLPSFPIRASPGPVTTTAPDDNVEPEEEEPEPPIEPTSPIPPSPPPTAPKEPQKPMEPTTPTPGPDYTKVPYTSVTWLNQTVSDNGLFLVPPCEVDENDVIALNETDVCTNYCSDGTDCRHFIFCVLQIFVDDVQKFLPFKCHIAPNFLGVCCPLNSTQLN